MNKIKAEKTSLNTNDPQRTKKAYRAMRKMRRKHKKELIKFVRNDEDYDWSFLHDYIILKIRHMYEYFSAGNWIMQHPEELKKTVASIKEVVDIIDKMEHCHDDWWEYEQKFPTCILHQEDGTISVEDSEEIRAKKMELLNKAELEHDKLFQQFYTKIGKNITRWWD